MVWVLEGKCVQCGACCKAGFAKFIESEITGYCKYLSFEDGKYVCKVTTGETTYAEMTDRDIAYYINQCKTFPIAEDAAYRPPRYDLPDTCGYSIVWKEDITNE